MSFRSDEIDYTINGHELQSITITLDPGEAVVAEAGAMMFMDSGIEMRTILGDGGPAKAGILGKLAGATMRKMAGENFVMTMFTNNDAQRRHVGFATPHPGMVLPLDLRQMNGAVLAQKESFLCAARGIKVSIGINRRLGAGFFGGEGFVMQKISGDGLAFIHAGGSVVMRELGMNDSVAVDTGCLVAMEQSVDYDIETIRGIGSMMFAGEGLFLARLKGPGKIWIQSMPFGRTVEVILNEVMQGVNENRK